MNTELLEALEQIEKEKDISKKQEEIAARREK